MSTNTGAQRASSRTKKPIERFQPSQGTPSSRVMQPQTPTLTHDPPSSSQQLSVSGDGSHGKQSKSKEIDNS